MKTILVPCDFSQPSVSALRMALDIAEKCRGSITLLNIIELPVVQQDSMVPVVGGAGEPMMVDLEESATKSLQELVAKHNNNFVPVRIDVEFGPVFSVLNNFIHENSVDLIVIGSHGSNGDRGIFIGSNASRIVRHASVPVFVVKDYSTQPIHDIVFPNSLEEGQSLLIAEVKQLQMLFDATLHIVWINTPRNFMSDKESFKKLEQFVHKHDFKDYTLNISNHNTTEEGILHFAGRMRGCLIAMGTHGRTGLAHVLFGSIAEEIVYQTDALVWTYNQSNEPAHA